MQEKAYQFFPKTVRLEVTEQNARDFVKDNVDNFLDWMFRSNGYTMSEYIEENMELFTEFILSGGAAE